MTDQVSIVIDPDGTIHAVHNEELGLHKLGEAKMRRVTDVSWDEELQAWRPVLLKGDGSVGAWTDRREAVDAEVAALNLMIKQGRLGDL